MKNRVFRNFRFGFTLIEILLALGLVITILGMLWSMMGMFARTYMITENRVSRSQLVRSISQMLNEDLGAAIQDPVHALSNEGLNAQVRRFGLRGNAVSLQIDVVQPNLFAPAQSMQNGITENNSGTSAPNDLSNGSGNETSSGFAGGLSNGQLTGESGDLFSDHSRNGSDTVSRSKGKHQVPELKTIYYEFIPPGRRFRKDQKEKKESESVESDGGSQIVGSLQTPETNDLAVNPDQESGNSFGNENFSGTDQGINGGMTGMESAVPLPGTPGGLIEKFGLSRRELDFETPPENAVGSGQFIDGEDSGNDSKFVGSLQAPPDQGNSELVSTAPNTNGANFNESGQNAEVTSDSRRTLPLTVSELAMITGDGTMWAPEVVDCRFDYFDGTAWFSDWDSIERSGLPKAIRVSLVLMSLDDVQQLRLSREFMIWSEGREEKRINLEQKESNGSQIVGSLQNSQAGFTNEMTGFPNSGFSGGAMDQAASDPIRGLSFAELARTLGLSPPMEREVITRVPTTPLSEHQIQQRRQPMTRSNETAVSGKRQNTAPEKVIERTPIERTITERTTADRTAGDRTAGNRTAENRTAGNRSFSDRNATERSFDDRTPTERSLGDRVVAERELQERTFSERSEDRTNEAFVPEKFPEMESAAVPFQESLVPDPVGEASVSTKRSVSTPRQATQTWIRGKR